MSLDRDALDRWITDSRYSEQLAVATCEECGFETPIVIHNEYGGSQWEPPDCRCGNDFSDSTPWREDEPPEPDYEPADSGRWEEA